MEDEEILPLLCKYRAGCVFLSVEKSKWIASFIFPFMSLEIEMVCL